MRDVSTYNAQAADAYILGHALKATAKIEQLTMVFAMFTLALKTDHWMIQVRKERDTPSLPTYVFCRIRRNLVQLDSLERLFGDVRSRHGKS